MVYLEVLMSNDNQIRSLFGMLKHNQKHTVSKTKASTNEFKKMVQQSKVGLKVGFHPDVLQVNEQQPIFHNPEHPNSRLIDLKKQDQPLSHQNQFNLLIPNSSPRKITLKDYLQFNTLERKAKRRSSNSNSKLQTSGESFMMESAVHREKGNLTNRPFIPQQPKSVPHSQFLKQQITAKINEEIKKLQDFSHFINNENTTLSQIQYEIFLCSIHSMLDKSSKISNQLGQKLLKQQQHSSDSKVNKSFSKRYFWNREKRILHSPAKIENKALDLTITELGSSKKYRP